MGFLKDLVIKLGLDSSGVDKGVNKAGSSLDKLKGTVGKLGAAFGIAFGVSEVINFGKELFSLAAKAEGVRKAFERIAPTGLLSDLRRSTRGAVSDFDLMKNAVSASNFKIPLENLGSYLAFATKRAEETGQSVDYLVDSIIMGIGRKSPMILDNLGISIVDIRNEMEKTGDMAKAVANIIDREMANAGNTVDTSATKVAQMTTAWTNFKEVLGGLFTGGVANSFSWLTNWLNDTNRILSSETIPWYEKLAATLGQVIPGMGVSRSATSSKLNAEESRKKGIDTEAGLLATNMPKSTETSATKLDKWIKSQKELLKIEGQYNVLNVANLKVWEARRKELSDAAAKEEERLAKEDEASKTAQENARKEIETEQKKKAESEASRKLAEQNIAANKASITDYETLIKLNEERYKMASSDTLRNQILKENGALKLQLELLNQSAIRYAEISGKKLKAAPVTGVKSLDRKTVDISGMNTDDLKNATAEFGNELDTAGQMAEDFKTQVQDSMVSAFSIIAEALGGVSDLNIGQVISTLLMPFADMAIAAGTIIMTTGIAIEAIRDALGSFIGAGAIAAGGILIGVGVAAKAGLSALAYGGGGGSSKAASASGGSFVDTNSFYTRQNEIKVTGQLYGKGSDLYAVVETETSRRKRGF